MRNSREQNKLLHIMYISFMFTSFAPPAGAGSGRDANGWKHVERWLVEAESEAIPTGGAGVDARAAANLGHRLVVATSDDQLRYFVGHPDERLGVDWKNEPFNLDMRVREGQLIKYRVFNRMVEFAELRRGAVVPDPIGRDALFFFFPSWPLRGYPAPRIGDAGMILVVSEAVGSDHYEAVPGGQSIGQEFCKLFRSKKGVDDIWLSESKEFCIMKRRWSVDSNKTTIGELTTNHVAELAPGLWAPTEVEIAYHLDRPGEARRTIRRTRTRIMRCEFDKSVSPRALDLALPPGTIETTPAGGIRQLSPGGTELLLESAKFYRERIGLPQRPKAPDPLTPTFLQAAAGVAAGSLGGTALRQRLRRRPPRAVDHATPGGSSGPPGTPGSSLPS